MGKLAMWGALAGAGKGIQAAADDKEKRDQMDIEAKRQERLLQLQRDAIAEEGVRNREHQTGLNQLEMDQRAQLSGATIASQQAVASLNRQTDLDIESSRSKTAIETANIAAGARGDRTGPLANLLSGKRYESRSLTEAEKNQYGLTVEKDVPAVFDKDTGKIYLQKGSRLEVPQYDSANYYQLSAEQKQGAEGALKSQPTEENVAEFEGRYGYLPANTFTWMRQFYSKQQQE